MFRYTFILVLLTSLTFAACESEEPDDSMVTDPAEDILEGEVAPEIPEITDADLEKYAHINLIADRMELDPVSDREQFLSVIEDQGLTQERYAEVHLAVEREPRLLLRFHEMMDELRESEQ